MRLDKSRVAALMNADFGQQMLADGDRAQAGNPEKDQVWNLLVTEIDPDPDQPRRYFDQGALDDLAADISRRGVLQPIMVRPVGERYRIIFGERRWRSSQIAGKPRIPCLIREMDPSSIRQAQLVENVIREGISDVERGLSLRQLYETMKSADRKVTWDQVAQQVGLTRMRINNLYGLSFLPQPIIDMIQTHRLSGSHGLELSRLQDRPDLQLQAAEEACRKETGSGAYGLSVAQLRQRINALLGTSRPPARRPLLSPAQIAARSEELLDALRPNLSADVRQRLRDTAEHIIRFLEEDPPGNDFVKSTLQSRRGAGKAQADTEHQPQRTGKEERTQR